ncbi:hypothetical protein [Caballeronia sordidicola]|uniref:Uncharacterized protein n=1 Tax=Caballeronia sordidicola TaxID=196367 RepID=A0A242MT52_CABSO|nr:hypothetical protein [Caballeronia sordidicola]OTP74448.1 hypothetical protein PAMC26510_16540 [Caballeronia sordidicola]
MTEQEFIREIEQRVGELGAIFQQFEGRDYAAIGSESIRVLYTKILKCQLRLEQGAEHFPHSAQNYSERARLAGEHAELIHAEYEYQRKCESISSCK